MKRHSGIDYEPSSKRRKADNDLDGLFVYKRRVYDRIRSNDAAGYLVGSVQTCAQLDKWWKSERLKAGRAVEGTDSSVGQSFAQRSLVSSHSDTVQPSDSRGLVTIREILDDDRDCRASFNIEASVVGHTPAPVENYVSMWCKHLRKKSVSVPSTASKHP